MKGNHQRLAAVLIAGVALIVTACDPTVPPTAPGTKRVVLLGDSVPSWLIKDGSAGVDTTKITLINGTLEACDGAKDNPPARSTLGKVAPQERIGKPRVGAVYGPVHRLHQKPDRACHHAHCRR